jgi:hypothetical protein
VSPEKYSEQMNMPLNDYDLSHLDVATSLSGISEKGVSVCSCEIRGSDDGELQEYGLLGYDITWFVRWVPTSQRN